MVPVLSRTSASRRSSAKLTTPRPSPVRSKSPAMPGSAIACTARKRLPSRRTSARGCNTQSDLPSAASRIATAGFPRRVLRATASFAASISHTAPLSGISTYTAGRSGFASTAPGAPSRLRPQAVNGGSRVRQALVPAFRLEVRKAQNMLAFRWLALTAWSRRPSNSYRTSLMNLRSLFSLFSSDLAIDLGTANTLVFAKGKGIVVNEPSIVALNKNTGEVEAVGKEAKEMLGRTPGNIVAIKPMKDGVIADFKVTERMLNYFIQKAHGRKVLVHPRIVIGVPSEITQVEKRAVMDSAYRAKASEVHLVEQAMVAAIGAGLPITEPSGNMVVDIGGGTTDVAVISLSGIVYSRSVRVAGNEMDNAIMQYLKRKYNLLIGERTAEAIKIQIGSAFPLDKPLTMEIKGRNLIEGVPKTLTVDDSEIREALAESVAPIMNAIRVALERTPPELSADISDRGIVLTGGGAMLKNLDKRTRKDTALPVSIAEDPLASVVLGTGKMLTEFKLLRRIAIY